MAKKDYYDVLGVGKTATAEDIKRAYRKKAVELHPDKAGGDEARFKELSEAYETLKDPQKRQRYDQFGHAAGPGGPGGGGAGFGGFEGFDFSGFGGQQQGFEVDLNDIFGSFFGGAQRRRGRNVQTAITITFEEAVFGTKKQIQGLGDETVRIDVPAGVENGNVMRLRGQGERVEGGEAGDLLIQIRVRPHAEFKREGPHVVSSLAIDMAEAALGSERKVNTVDGPLTLKIPPGTQSGQRIKIAGKGVPTGRGRGDHLVEVEVEIPKKISKRQRELLEQFAAEDGKKFWQK